MSVADTAVIVCSLLSGITAIVAAYDTATSEALTNLVRWVDAKTPPLPPIDSAPASTSTSTYTKSTTTRRP